MSLEPPPLRTSSSSAEPDPTPSRSGLLGTLERLLTGAAAPRPAPPGRTSLAVLILAAAGFALYGAVAGLFAGGPQVLLAAAKAPLIVLASMAICLPSLFVFTSLAGARYARGELLALVAELAGMLALLLAALAPVSWLFSVSSRSLLAVTLLHAAVWTVALLFARRRLRAGLPPAARFAGGLWLFLFLLVSFQMTTQLRPVLYRPAGAPLFAPEKRFFLEHLGETADVSTPAAGVVEGERE